MKLSELKNIIKEEISNILKEDNFNPPSTPASPGGNASPEEHLKFYEGQYQALSNRMREFMDKPSTQRLLDMPNSWDKMPQFIKELSNYMDMYENAIRYTKKFIKGNIKEEYSSASKLYEIEGVIVIDTDTAFHKQIMSDVRAVKGITIVKDYIYEPVGGAENRGYATLTIKIDPSPFKQMKPSDIVDQVVNDIKSIKGVRAFKVKKGPFQATV